MKSRSMHPIPNPIDQPMKTHPSRPVLDPRTHCCREFLVRLALLLVLLGGARVSLAAPVEFMSYQGFLIDANGNPLATNSPANYPVTFRIFADSTGGQPSWSEQQVVTVDKGNFSVVLGEGAQVSGEAHLSLSSVFNGATARYMQLSVTIGGTTTDLLPRLQLLTAPYAFLAGSANQLVNPGGLPVVAYANSRVEVTAPLYASSVNAGGVISGNGSGLTGLTAAQIPALDAGKITTGVLSDPRIPSLSASKITSGVFSSVQIPSLDASKITTGTFGAAQIPSLDAGKITTGQLNTNRIPQNLGGHNFLGSVGIGTNSPDAALHVQGTVKMLGQLAGLYSFAASDNDTRSGTATTDGFLTVVITHVGKTGNLIARVRGYVDSVLCGAASCNTVSGEDWPVYENSFMLPVPKGSTWRVTYSEDSLRSTMHADLVIKWTPMGR